MQVYNTNKLIDNLIRKGIGVNASEKRKFVNYNYYQVINAYKNLFIDGIETIDEITNNILNGKDIERYKKCFNLGGSLNNQQMALAVCKYICKKYDRYPKSKTLNGYISEIDGFKYYHHIYDNRVRYSDFIRIYKFEHELRTILLRYVLIIEESLKTIFVSYLNDIKSKDSFFMDINNYKNDSKNINASIDSIKLILEKQKNKYSKPLSRKKDQNINIPYWIMVNELTMKETLKIINILKEEYYKEIYLKCIEKFTIFNINKTPLTEVDKLKCINQMRNILDLISNFRNLLAHNQPLYLFNIKDITSRGTLSINYEYPKVSNQATMNVDTMSILSKFYGSDRYNSRTQNVNIDLSWIIYTIYKIISTIDHNNTLFDELENVYRKYAIIANNPQKKLDDYDSLQKLLDSIDRFIEYDYNSKEIIDNIEKKNKYKGIIKSKGIEIRTFQNDIKKLRKKTKIIEEKSAYNIFQFLNKYTAFTGIDSSFFSKIK